MECNYKINYSKKQDRFIKNPKCKRIKGLIKLCDEENCNYIKKQGRR